MGGIDVLSGGVVVVVSGVVVVDESGAMPLSGVMLLSGIAVLPGAMLLSVVWPVGESCGAVPTEAIAAPDMPRTAAPRRMEIRIVALL
ncbi:MAG: hypothetical protein ACTHKR_13215 [Sphingomonas sp.]